MQEQFGRAVSRLAGTLALQYDSQKPTHQPSDSGCICIPLFRKEITGRHVE